MVPPSPPIVVSVSVVVVVVVVMDGGILGSNSMPGDARSCNTSGGRGQSYCSGGIVEDVIEYMRGRCPRRCLSAQCQSRDRDYAKVGPSSRVPLPLKAGQTKARQLRFAFSRAPKKHPVSIRLHTDANKALPLIKYARMTRDDNDLSALLQRFCKNFCPRRALDQYPKTTPTVPKSFSY